MRAKKKAFPLVVGVSVVALGVLGAGVGNAEPAPPSEQGSAVAPAANPTPGTGNTPGNPPGTTTPPAKPKHVVVSSELTNSINLKTVKATCPAGYKVAGGGHESLLVGDGSFKDLDAIVRSSKPVGDNGWEVIATTTYKPNWKLKTWAVCLG
ncbi:hypothetical protein [Streptomyces sp. NPDC005805]|uniref:hypothetical protein n=1 Tax=Streptomyces sp. NPDC005805 TaxID=3157068 RepID=UPI00340805A5